VSEYFRRYIAGNAYDALIASLRFGKLGNGLMSQVLEAKHAIGLLMSLEAALHSALRHLCPGGCNSSQAEHWIARVTLQPSEPAALVRTLEHTCDLQDMHGDGNRRVKSNPLRSVRRLSILPASWQRIVRRHLPRGRSLQSLQFSEYVLPFRGIFLGRIWLSEIRVKVEYILA